jgi:hypothetical protein
MLEESCISRSEYQNFWKQLKVGQQFEAIAHEKIRNLYNNSIKKITTNNTSAYDFKIFPSNETFEVKADLLAIKTGHFFIETYGYGKPSGISISDAKFYIITDTKYYFLIQTDKLKELMIDCQIMKTRDEKTLGFLINRFDLVKNSKLI